MALAPDCAEERWRNAAATTLVPSPLPPHALDAISLYVASRRDQRRRPPPIRLELGERAFYLRVVEAQGIEVALFNEEVLRDGDAFQLLNARYGVSRREYQVLVSLRLGKTNRQIAADLGLAEGTIGLHVHHLLERFDVPNRTRLVKVIEEILAKRS